LPNPQALFDVVTNCDYTAGKFVAGDGRVDGNRVITCDEMAVSAAYTAAVNFNDDLARRRARIGNDTDGDFPGLVDKHSAHQLGSGWQE
jgi:hypothetical protein